jgi:hypothetical protein
MEDPFLRTGERRNGAGDVGVGDGTGRVRE